MTRLAGGIDRISKQSGDRQNNSESGRDGKKKNKDPDPLGLEAPKGPSVENPPHQPDTSSQLPITVASAKKGPPSQTTRLRPR